MAKSAFKTDTIPTFDTNVAVDQMRGWAEKSLEQSREAYARLRSGAEEAQKTFETTYETAKTAGADLSLKAVAAMRANADAGFNHVESLLGATSISEVVELQTAYFRSSFETMLEQAKDFQTSVAGVAEAVGQPAKSAAKKAVDRTTAELKAA